MTEKKERCKLWTWATSSSISGLSGNSEVAGRRTWACKACKTSRMVSMYKHHVPEELLQGTFVEKGILPGVVVFDTKKTHEGNMLGSLTFEKGLKKTRYRFFTSAVCKHGKRVRCAVLRCGVVWCCVAWRGVAWRRQRQCELLIRRENERDPRCTAYHRRAKGCDQLCATHDRSAKGSNLQNKVNDRSGVSWSSGKLLRTHRETLWRCGRGAWWLWLGTFTLQRAS